MRAAGYIVSITVIVAVGANTQGQSDILSLAFGPSEAEAFWTD